MVVRYHGPTDPGRIHEQTHTFEPDRAFNFLITIHPARSQRNRGHNVSRIKNPLP